MQEPKKSESTYGQRYDELGLEKDRYVNQSLNAKLGYNITDLDRVYFNLQAINGDVDYDNGSGSTNDSTIPNTYLQNRFYTLGYKHNGATHKINVNYNLSTFKRRVTGTYPAPVSTTNYLGSINELKADDKITYAKDSFIVLVLRFKSLKMKR